MANLRNLALAQARAATDALTGLANKREAEETLKRMTAQAGRTVSCLAAVMFDLDRFKKINARSDTGRAMRCSPRSPMRPWARFARVTSWLGTAARNS